LIVCVASTSFALPPPTPRYREGANHHVGDDSFVVRFGRLPGPDDSEQLRMRTHLAYVRAWLAERPATRPELAAKRATLIGYLDEYIAKDITPKNLHVPWRSPVFIDDAGTICAVGYLMERSAGNRALPEKIAVQHRYDYLEDIASAMPEVQAWIDGSGMTLEELASIQPAYEEPEAQAWKTWNPAARRPKDGLFAKGGVTGTFKQRRMEGEWKVAYDGGTLAGKGEMKRGAGVWTSFYPDGKRMAEGLYANNRANGAWRFFHQSGNLAAEGSFAGGNRTGRWRFYYDTSKPALIATGSFASDGEVIGKWRHFDADGKLLATSRIETPTQWDDPAINISGGEGFTLDIVPGVDGVRHQIHQGTVQPEIGSPEAHEQKLELLSIGREHVYIHSAFFRETMYDADGFQLAHGTDGWTASDCRWSAKRMQVAHDGDVARLHGVLYNDARRRSVHRHVEGKFSYSDVIEDVGPRCRAPIPVAAERAKRLDTMLATRALVRAKSPEFVRKQVLDRAGVDDGRADDLTKVLSAHMAMYLEWPHIDGRFVAVFATMPGRYSKHWYDGDAAQDPLL
jgi:hypothetical protein